MFTNIPSNSRFRRMVTNNFHFSIVHMTVSHNNHWTTQKWSLSLPSTMLPVNRACLYL